MDWLQVSLLAWVRFFFYSACVVLRHRNVREGKKEEHQNRRLVISRLIFRNSTSLPCSLSSTLTRLQGSAIAWIPLMFSFVELRCFIYEGFGCNTMQHVLQKHISLPQFDNFYKDDLSLCRFGGICRVNSVFFSSWLQAHNSPLPELLGLQSYASWQQILFVLARQEQKFTLHDRWILP